MSTPSNGSTTLHREDYSSQYSEHITNSNGVHRNQGHHFLHLCYQEPELASSTGIGSTFDDGASLNVLTEEDINYTSDKQMGTQSLNKSIPVTNAEPETSRIASVLAYTTEVEMVSETDENMPDARGTNDKEGISRPALISVRIHKPYVDIPLGITFRSVFGELVIGDINPSSLLGDCPLRRGDRLVNMDHHRSTTHWTAVQAANYLREKQGAICFVVHTKNGEPNIAEAAVYKSRHDENLGISFRNENGRLQIENISSEGLIGNVSVLHPGDFVVSINDMDVSGLDPSLALEIISDSMNLITIRVTNTDATNLSWRDVWLTNMSTRIVSEGVEATANEMNSWDLESGFVGHDDFDFRVRPGYISFKVYKPTVYTDLGLTFARTEDDQLQIDSISSEGMLMKSPIASGLIVLSIGHVRCLKWTIEQAREAVTSAVGELLFIFCDPAGSTSYAMAVAYKSTPRSMVGLSFKSSGEDLRLGSIPTDGMFFDSVLNNEDAVVSINNVLCQRLPPRDAVAITQRIPEIVIVLVKMSRSNCIVLSHKSAQPENTSVENTNVENTSVRKMSQKRRTLLMLVVMLVMIIIIVASVVMI